MVYLYPNPLLDIHVLSRVDGREFTLFVPVDGSLTYLGSKPDQG